MVKELGVDPINPDFNDEDTISMARKDIDFKLIKSDLAKNCMMLAGNGFTATSD